MGAVLDGPEVGTVPPALADVEGGLAEVALLRVHLVEVGEVIDPAGLGAGADVDVDALHRQVDPHRVPSTLEDVVDPLLL
jgi:hypothetical protein